MQQKTVRKHGINDSQEVGVNSLKYAGVRREKNIQGLFASGDEHDAFWWLLEQVLFSVCNLPSKEKTP